MNPFYRDYGDFLAGHFDFKVQKLTVDAGFTCPNRDGSLGRGGCIYCNNSSFSPTTGSEGRSVSEQLADGKRFFAAKYPNMRYLAYFQSYTSTYGDIDRLLGFYREALAVDDVVGIVIGTRPDCMPQPLLEALAEINRHYKVFIEYGAETSHDSTLRAINRCHDWATTVDAVRRTADAGIPVGLHLILGLPGENVDMMLETVDRVSALPIDTVKFHQLQIVRGTRLAADYLAGRADLRIFDIDEYVALCARIVRRLRKDIAIERFVSQSPDRLLIAPRWGLKNYQFTNLLHKYLE
ncbi:MAG: TIGR01212 family radical SAM protein [Muribaculaceae bacterium]|nr:TIGR01212 family radical SAM protein [Muribaculaceae bacterium]